VVLHSLFELKSWRHIFINGGYSIVSLTLMGKIIGAWRQPFEQKLRASRFLYGVTA
jgi:hypothetical protein